MSNESVTRVPLYLYFAFIPLLQLDVFRASLVSAALYENWDLFFFLPYVFKWIPWNNTQTTEMQKS